MWIPGEHQTVWKLAAELGLEYYPKYVVRLLSDEVPDALNKASKWVVAYSSMATR